MNEAWDVTHLGVSVYLNAVCYRSKDVKRLENLKRQVVVREEEKHLKLKIQK